MMPRPLRIGIIPGMYHRGTLHSSTMATFNSKEHTVYTVHITKGGRKLEEIENAAEQ